MQYVPIILNLEKRMQIDHLGKILQRSKTKAL